MVTVGLTIHAVARTPTGTRTDLRPAWWALWATVVAATLYGAYPIAGGSWLWY
jgi:hypothetical protein